MKLYETSMNRMLSLGEKDGYMCISADRQLPKKDDGYTQHEREVQKQINNKNREKLEDELNGFGLSFVKVIGGYPEEGNESEMIEEQTFFVLNYDIYEKAPINLDDFTDIGIFLCNSYGQDAVLIYDPRTSKPTYYNKNGNIVGTFNGKVVNDMQSIYYTCFQKSTKGRNREYNGKDWRFTYVESLRESLADEINYSSVMSYKKFLKKLGNALCDTSDMEELTERLRKEYTLFREGKKRYMIEVVNYIIIVMDFSTKRKFVNDLKNGGTITACDLNETLNVEEIMDYFMKM